MRAAGRTLRDYGKRLVRPFPVANDARDMVIGLGFGLALWRELGLWLDDQPDYVPPLLVVALLALIAGGAMQYERSKYRLRFVDGVSVQHPHDQRHRIVRLEARNSGPVATLTAEMAHVFSANRLVDRHFPIAWQNWPTADRDVAGGAFLKIGTATFNHGGGLSLTLGKPGDAGSYSSLVADPGDSLDFALRIDSRRPDTHFTEWLRVRVEPNDGTPELRIVGQGRKVRQAVSEAGKAGSIPSS